MSHRPEVIEIPDSDSELELETSQRSTPPEILPTTPQIVGMAEFASSFYTRPTAFASQVDPRYANSSNGWIDDDDLPPPSIFEIGQSSGTAPIFDGPSSGVPLIGGSFGIAPAVDATTVTVLPVEPTVVPPTITVEPMPETSPLVPSESLVERSESRVPPVPTLVYFRRRKRVRTAGDAATNPKVVSDSASKKQKGVWVDRCSHCDRQFRELREELKETKGKVKDLDGQLDWYEELKELDDSAMSQMHWRIVELEELVRKLLEFVGLKK